MFDSQLYPFVGRSRRLPPRDNNGRCVNQARTSHDHKFRTGKYKLFIIIYSYR